MGFFCGEASNGEGWRSLEDILDCDVEGLVIGDLNELNQRDDKVAVFGGLATTSCSFLYSFRREIGLEKGEGILNLRRLPDTGLTVCAAEVVFDLPTLIEVGSTCTGLFLTGIGIGNFVNGEISLRPRDWSGVEPHIGKATGEKG